MDREQKLVVNDHRSFFITFFHCSFFAVCGLSASWCLLRMRASHVGFHDAAIPFYLAVYAAAILFVEEAKTLCAIYGKIMKKEHWEAPPRYANMIILSSLIFIGNSMLVRSYQYIDILPNLFLQQAFLFVGSTILTVLIAWYLVSKIMDQAETIQKPAEVITLDYKDFI